MNVSQCDSPLILRTATVGVSASTAELRPCPCCQSKPRPGCHPPSRSCTGNPSTSTSSPSYSDPHPTPSSGTSQVISDREVSDPEVLFVILYIKNMCVYIYIYIYIYIMYICMYAYILYIYIYVCCSPLGIPYNFKQ